jgi:hypothetical protein
MRPPTLPELGEQTHGPFEKGVDHAEHVADRGESIA